MRTTFERYHYITTKTAYALHDKDLTCPFSCSLVCILRLKDHLNLALKYTLINAYFVNSSSLLFKFGLHAIDMTLIHIFMFFPQTDHPRRGVSAPKILDIMRRRRERLKSGCVKF